MLGERLGGGRVIAPDEDAALARARVVRDARKLDGDGRASLQGVAALGAMVGPIGTNAATFRGDATKVL